MSKNDRTAERAINAFLDVIRDTAAEDPAFRTRLVEVLGLNVVYEGEEQFEGADPVKQAARWSEDAFTRIWDGASITHLKSVMKTRGLATNTDMSGLKKPDLLALLYRRAFEQAENTGLV